MYDFPKLQSTTDNYSKLHKTNDHAYIPAGGLAGRPGGGACDGRGVAASKAPPTGMYSGEFSLAFAALGLPAMADPQYGGGGAGMDGTGISSDSGLFFFTEVYNDSVIISGGWYLGLLKSWALGSAGGGGFGLVGRETPAAMVWRLGAGLGSGGAACLLLSSAA